MSPDISNSVEMMKKKMKMKNEVARNPNSATVLLS
ncbi:unnamed protein product [Callosobruchus maculatus]|uniref:Uncharacterized protein n=1 Tax=Callosobruchus maculatus TaxID=64391 RepID=A0A653DCU8_CALMS|nr:unnamed protein product [Callosobruchus maculatus]